MAVIPKDPFMLLSYLNTALRDHYASLSEACEALEISESEVCETLKAIDYEYDASLNRFA